MKRKNTIFSKLYVVLCLAFFYLPILVTMIFSFNSSKSLTRFTGFSLRWYGELINNMEISKAVYVSVSIAILATIISTVLGTITAIGLSKSRKVLKELLLTINNFPILNPEIVTAIGLMLLFSSLGMTKGYLTMLLAHIAFCTPYVITSVYPKVRSLDPNLANAAMDLGATPYQALTKVIVPMIKEGIFAGALLAFTMSFDDFVISYFVSGNGVKNISIVVYNRTKRINVYHRYRSHCGGAAFGKSGASKAPGFRCKKDEATYKKDRGSSDSSDSCDRYGKMDDRKPGKPYTASIQCR